MSDAFSQQRGDDSAKTFSEQDQKISEALIDFFEAEDAATLSKLFNELLSPERVQHLQEYLQEIQTTDNDIAVLLVKMLLSLLQDAQQVGIDGVVARYLVERQRVIEALELLDATQNDEEFYRILAENQQELLTDLALAFLTSVYYGILERENAEVEAGALKQQIDIIRDARKSGVQVAWERAAAESKQVLEALDLLEQQDTHEKTYHVLQEKQEILITKKAIWLLQARAAELRQQENPLADCYESYAFLIKDAYTRNLVDAWGDYAGVDLVILAIQKTDEPDEILKIMQAHEKVLRSEAALYVLRSYIAQAKANGSQQNVRYYERWFHLLEDARTSGITDAWRKFYNNLLAQVFEQQSSAAPQTISDLTSALAHLVPETLEWADIVSRRGQAYYFHVMGKPEDKRMIELAIADYRAVLSVYKKYGTQDRYAETLEMLGTTRFFYLMLDQGGQIDLARGLADLPVVLFGTQEDLPNRPFHDPLLYRQQAIDEFSRTLTLYKKQHRQADWIRILFKRAAAYSVVRKPEETLLAIDDYSAALAVLKKEASPYEWTGAVGNRGICYLEIMGDGYEERLKKAVADLEAALSVYTRQASPGAYRKMQLFLYQAFERLGKWEEAYRAIREAIAAQRDLLAMNPGEKSRLSLIADVANVGVEIYILAAEVLLHFNRPPLTEIACLLEEARTQNLRLALSLDTLAPEGIADVAARRRAEKFLAAQKEWQQHQSETSTLLMPSNRITLHEISQEQEQAQNAYAVFIKAVDAIRKHDDPDFMAPTPSFDDILRAVSTPNTALVYLAAGVERGLALLIICNGKGTQQTHYIPLPQLKARTIAQFIETDPTKHVPIKLEQALSTLGALGLNDVVEVLSGNGVQKVRIIPFGQLGLFPFPAVQVQPVRGDKKCLSDFFEVTIAPSARAMEIAEKRAANINRATHPYLLLGGDPYPRLQNVKELPSAQAEAETLQKIATRFGYGEENIRYLDSLEVTKEKVVKVLKHAWYAHLAVHGVYQPDNPRRSHLLLAGDEKMQEEDRCLFLEEAIDRKTIDKCEVFNLEGMRLLILSACETAIIDVKQTPDEFIGLAAGFLQAGVAGVIASLWAVDDLATYLLMTRFAQLYLDPQRSWSPARALAEAQRWLREDATYKLLMTYDPVRGMITDETATPAQEGKRVQIKKTDNFAGSRIRSLRDSDKRGFSHVQAQREPDVVPYADAVYWAAFVVTGC